MKLKIYNKNIFLFEFKSQKEMTLTFHRMQEFYESPYKSIKGKRFTTEQFLSKYTKKNGNLTYFNQWKGFNIPGKIVDKFEKFLSSPAWERETKILQVVNSIEKDYYVIEKDYYVIACLKNDKHTKAHELCHGIYYLDKDFNKKAKKLISKSLYKKMKKKLVKLGYSDKKIIIDAEIVAYLSTSPRKEREELFGEVKYKPFRKLFNKVKLTT